MRTDQRHICLRCLRRQPERRACAGCRHEVLADTAATEGRAAVLARLQKEADEIHAARDAALQKQAHSPLKWEALGGGVGVVVAVSQGHWAAGAALAVVFGGVYLAHTRWESRLGEGRIEDGDTVTCQGPSESEPTRAPYRHVRAVVVYRGTSAHPVVVRRATTPV
jgi:hypothetical protein